MDQPICLLPTFVSDDCLESWQLIGSGGFGQIHRAKHKKWGMDVAIKLLHYNDGTEDLLREAELMHQGGNPNVLRILGVYKTQGQADVSAIQVGLVMEYMERGSLADLQKALNGPPPWPLTFRIINQIALGMNFLHQLNPPILHLDLKPSNVLLDDSLNAKLTDFGLAKIAKSSSKVIEDKDEEAAGTTSYMPPEAFGSSRYVPNFSTDVYSYGILLWSVIAGKQPYDFNISSLLRFRIREGDRPNLTSLDSSQADGLSNVIDLMKCCWDSDPKIRPKFIDCIEVTKNVYDLHRQHVPDAVHTILKQLDNKEKSCSSSAPLSRKPQTLKEGLKQHKEPTKKTLATPTQEIGPIPAPNRAGMYCSSAPRAPLPMNMQRQFSSPSSVNMCLSNVSAVQIGNNNYMNVTIQKGRQRQRHPTAPPATRQPSKHQNQNPPNIKP
ncbi:receptor-interacting serine/threonine-protein kinase 3 isoform X1 [Tachysurus vachellii]|uniref:receptor-interacting serine/threonine-protein kinase 3 isoform X1 n=1 Tax=Tachysurus vachellii TaxID=175792 RepID=UPI00296AE6F4|nr:receptor-interacting serine/threonine-protein kinase 3 isoform X1 [Tachysurus vachellii]